MTPDKALVASRRPATARAWIERVLQRPQAGIWAGEWINSQQLAALIDSRRERLVEHHIGEGSAVVVAVEDPSELIGNLLALWSLNATAVLVSHRLPPHALADVRKLSGARAMITGMTGDVALSLHRAERAPADHALVLSTSGSTGHFKLVGLDWPTVLIEIERTALTRSWFDGSQSTVSLVANAHRYGLFNGPLYALHTGTALALASGLGRGPLIDAVSVLDTPAQTVTVPSHLDLLSRTGPAKSPRALCGFISAGEALTAALEARGHAVWGVPIRQNYGTTETGVIAIDDATRKLGDFSRILPGVDVFVADGEVAVRMARSPYLSSIRSDRWRDGVLYTGDAGHIQDGVLRLNGRVDDQISVGGLKVVLSELEQVVTSLPGVADCAVIYDGALRAYVVAVEGGPAPSDDELARQLRARLAPHQIPQIFTIVDALPKTPSGKRMRSTETLRALVDLRTRNA